MLLISVTLSYHAFGCGGWFAFLLGRGGFFFLYLAIFSYGGPVVGWWVCGSVSRAPSDLVRVVFVGWSMRIGKKLRLHPVRAGAPSCVQPCPFSPSHAPTLV